MGRDFYVSPVGSPSAAGTIADPWELNTAFKTAKLQPGDTVWLRAGTYTHTPQGATTSPANQGCIFQITVSGTPGNQITFRSYPGELAKIDGGQFAYLNASARPTLSIGSAGNAGWGNFITFQDIEVCSSSKEARQSLGDASFPTDISRSDGISIFGTGVKVINCIVHDVGAGISAWDQSKLTELYGNLIFNCGWQGTPHQHGHCIYTQHTYAGTQPMTIARNILASAFDKAIQMYGSSAKELARYHYKENISIGYGGRGGILLGSRDGGVADRVRDNQITDNFGFGSDLSLYYQPDDVAYLDLIATGNYFVGGSLQISSWKQANISGNTFVNLAKVSVWPNTNQTVPKWTMDRQSYLGTIPQFVIEGVAFYNLATWRAKTGFDINSTTGPAPTVTKIVLQNNAYDLNRAQLAIYNWSAALAVAVDVSALGWAAGETVIAHNAQDYFGDAKPLTIAPDGTITFNMTATAHTVAIPSGGTGPILPNTFPKFGAFILQKMGSTPPPPPPPPPPIVAPAITIQPGSQSVPVGRNVALTVSATGSQPMSYAWKKDGVTIPGVGGNILALVNVGVGDSGSYTVEVSNAAGTATSSPAVVTVSAPPPPPPPPPLTKLQELDAKIAANLNVTGDAQLKLTLSYIRDLIAEVQKL